MNDFENAKAAATHESPGQPEIAIPQTAQPERRRPGRNPRRQRTLGWVLAAAGVLILASIAWVGWRSYQAYDHLQNASAQVSRLQSDLKDVTRMDPAAASVTVKALQSEAAAARSAVDDPVFRMATVLPWLGPNLDAVRQVTLTVDSLSTDVMPGLVTVAQTLQPSHLKFGNGTIDLAPFETASPILQKAQSVITDASRQMAGIDRSALIAPVGKAVTQLRVKLDEAAGVTTPAARVARLLPPMLGSQGPRTYLMVMQNLAEVRATGGIFGNYAVIRADHGKISIVNQAATRTTLANFNPPIVTLSKSSTDLYGEIMAIFPPDVNLSPDFPTAAALFAKMYQQVRGVAVDGVIATDPVALSYALNGAPPIAMGDGVTLTSSTVVSVLLSTVYQKFASDGSQKLRDQFLASATARIFSALMSGTGSSQAILTGLGQAAQERRLLVWSAHAPEQSDIAQTIVAGSLSPPPSTPSIGAFLNDATAGKLDYYLTNSVRVTPGSCQSDGRRQLHVLVTLTNAAPRTGLPSYVIGATGKDQLLQADVLVFAPVGGGMVSTTRAGTPIGFHRGEDHSREVGVVRAVLASGTSYSVDYTVLGPAPSPADPKVVTPALILTPGVHPWKTDVTPYQNCTAAG